MAQASVFEQVIKIISRKEFHRSVSRLDGDKKTRALDCWSWFGALLFGQLSGHDSIRAIERVFCHSNSRIKRLGFRPVSRSTLSDANQRRPLGILEDILNNLISKAALVIPRSHGLKVPGQVLALDSTVINLCLSLCPWAKFRRGTAAVKLHTAIDLAGDLPEFFVITKALRHDVPIARKHFNFKPDTTVVFDRGYWSAAWLNELNQKGVYFVTRTRRNNRFEVQTSQMPDRTLGILCDQTVTQVVGDDRIKYEENLRRIIFKDPESGKILIFVTNHFELDAKTICDLYKARWKVELFFKTLKQNLKIKKFLGTSAHAVKAQILVALIAYVLVQIMRGKVRATISIVEAMAAIGTLLLIKEPLSIILGRLPRTKRHPPPLQLALF